ncbi:hypothetical protein KIN20_007915 [Parelaphostrongylus tenuis]|uniref:Uncharacterized protein n=1 Tax=Parelaphostrongylus tenuis TaxID=148309 RepID=A0AAD5QH50_PARTN|nr:hypothetical protein KIN20_007915 [Parelaphostrongylus tenuis]
MDNIRNHSASGANADTEGGYSMRVECAIGIGNVATVTRKQDWIVVERIFELQQPNARNCKEVLVRELM